jgi:hypothetical protein
MKRSPGFSGPFGLASAVLLMAACSSGTSPGPPATPELSPEAKKEAFDRYMKDRKGWLRLGAVPKISVRGPAGASKEEAERIRRLIRALSEIDAPDFGLSAGLSGNSFGPIEGTGEFHSGLLGDHGIRPSDAMKALVDLGPRALPFLLDALGDATPTGLTMQHEGGFGVMEHTEELWGNLAGVREQEILERRREEPPGDTKSLSTYTVRVGDACFVAIGQIVGRPYSAVRYQPTACIHINSPVETRYLRDSVRAIWTASNPRQALLDSLLVDYSTEGVFNGRSLDGWDVGNELQGGAALRLLYYFPEESAAMIAGRLGTLDVMVRPGIDGYMHREVQNGVRVKEFIKAVAWSSDARVRAQLLAIVRKTDDNEILLAAQPAVSSGDEGVLLQKLRTRIEALPPDERGPYGDGYNLLGDLWKRFPRETKAVFKAYLKDAGSQRIRTMCQLFIRQGGADEGRLAIELLAPILRDRRPSDGWTYAVNPGQNEPRLPIRLCDEAAEAVAHSNPGFVFAIAGPHENLDRQIEAILKKIEGSGRK